MSDRIRIRKSLLSFLTSLMATLLSIGAAVLLIGVAPGQNAQPRPREIKRLEQVSWDAVDHVMRIVVSRGTVGPDGKYKPDSLMDDYELRYDFEEEVGAPTMRSKDEIRKFSADEAAKVHKLMAVLSDYAVASVEWWEDGQGEPFDPAKARASKGRR